jgi:uncharacterized membrane protein (UPF0127 family)
MKVDLSYEGKPLIAGVTLADNFWLRLSGYMFRQKPHVVGLLFEPANAMQTTFMFFDLDMVFLTKENQVIKILRGVKPWRHTWFYKKTRKVLEVPAGVIPADLKEGMSIHIEETFSSSRE